MITPINGPTLSLSGFIPKASQIPERHHGGSTYPRLRAELPRGRGWNFQKMGFLAGSWDLSWVTRTELEL